MSHFLDRLSYFNQPREAFSGNNRQHLVHEQVDVLAPAGCTLPELERNFVRAEPGGHDAHWQRLR